MWIIPNHLSHKSIICIGGESIAFGFYFALNCNAIPHQAEHNETFTMGCDNILEHSRNTHRRARTHKGNVINIRDAKLWIFIANAKIYNKFLNKCGITFFWHTMYKPLMHDCTAELFPVNIYGTLLSPWTSPSLCWSSLSSSPRCLFRSWESRKSCARLAWKYQHTRKCN